MLKIWTRCAKFSPLKFVMFFACGLLCAASGMVWAQDAPQKVAPAAAKTPVATKKKKAAVDPDSPEGRKRRAVKELKALAEQAPSVETDPAMRATILMTAGKALREADPQAAVQMLESTLDINGKYELENSMDVTIALQESMRTLTLLDKEAAISYVNHASDAGEKALDLRTELVRVLVAKDPDRAYAMLTDYPVGAQYPYWSATDLFHKLPQGDERRGQLFDYLTKRYLEENRSSTPVRGDYVSLFLEQAEQLPQQRTIAIADAILKSAQESKFFWSRVADDGTPAPMTRTIYQFRVAQLLPLLRKIEPERADELAKEQPDAVGFAPEARKNQNYMQAAAPDYQSGEQERAQAIYKAQSAQIKAQIESDPKQALATAMSLPSGQRVGFLDKIFLDTYKAQSSVAQEAATEMVAELETMVRSDDAESFTTGYNDVRMALELPARWNEVDVSRAAEWCERLSKLVNELRDLDTDSSRRNEAGKSMWPSTVAAGVLVKNCREVSPGIGERTLESFDDSAVKLLIRVYEAAAPLAGSEDRHMFSIAVHTNGKALGTMGAY